MCLPTPLECRKLIVSPAVDTLHDRVLSTRLPERVNPKHSNPLIVALAVQLSVAVAVKESGVSRGAIVAGALHNGTGSSSSRTVTEATQKSESPVLSVTFKVTLLWPTGYGPAGD